MLLTIAPPAPKAAPAAGPALAARAPSTSTKELANLDVMRALAVLLVVVNHIIETAEPLMQREFSPFAWYIGRLGVLMFFVHTSLVLMLSMDRSRHQGIGFYMAFYVRRAFRIYPLSVVCVLLALALGMPPAAWIAGPPDHSAATVASNLLIVQNLFYSPLVVNPLWSLPLELQMYVVLPFAYRLLAARPLPSTAWGLWAVGVVLAVMQPWMPGGGRLSVLRFAPCFLAGVLAYTRLRLVQPTLPALGWPALLLGLTGLYLIVAPFMTEVHPAWLGWLYCLAIGLAVPHFVSVPPGWLQRASHEIGKYSYGVYLFHMVALWCGFGPTAPWSLGPVSGTVMFLVVLVGAPVLSFHLIERPMIDVGTRFAARWVPVPARPGVAAA